MCCLKISVDLLQIQERIFIKEDLSPEFLGISEKELKIDQPIHVEGQAYLSSDYLVINFSAKTYFQMPCKICNETIVLPLVEENYYDTISLDDINKGVYDFSDDLRQALLLKLPHFVECNDGSCPERKHIEKHLKKTSKIKDDSYLPFEKIL
jgi:hypothetical protein